MDAEHRHELKTNELADWLSHLPELIKKNTNFIIGAALILIGLLTWPLLSRMAQQKEIAQQSEATNSIQMLENDLDKAFRPNPDDPMAQQQALGVLLANADALVEKADELDNPNLAAMARIKAAQAMRTALQFRSEEVTAETIETQIKKAADAYQKAFEQGQTDVIKGLAKLGLGLCSEELGQTEQAREIYQDLVKNEVYAATVVPAQAQTRLDVLAEKVETVYFAPAPALPVETPATQLPAGIEAPAGDMPAIEAAPTIEAAPAEEQSAAEAAEMPSAPSVTETAPAPQPAAPAQQNAAPSE